MNGELERQFTATFYCSQHWHGEQEAVNSVRGASFSYKKKKKSLQVSVSVNSKVFLVKTLDWCCMQHKYMFETHPYDVKSKKKCSVSCLCFGIFLLLL